MQDPDDTERGAAPSWGRSMQRGIVWSNLSFFATRGVSVLSVLVLARLLTPDEFGVVAAVTIYITLLELVGDLGMKATVIFEQEEAGGQRVETAFTLNMIVIVILAGAGVAAAPLVADFFNVGDQTGLFRLAALNLLIGGFGNVHDGLLLRDLLFRRRAVPEFVRAIVRGFVSIGLAVAGLGALALVLGFIAGTVGWTISLWVLTRYVPRFTFDRAVARSMISYGGAAAILEVIGVIWQRIDQIAVGRGISDGALGLYTIAGRMPELVIESITHNISTVAFSGLSQQRQQDVDGLVDRAVTLIRIQCLYAFPAGAWLAIAGPAMVVTLFGSQWTAAGGVASAIAVRAAVGAGAFALGDTFKAIGRQRLLVLVNVFEMPVYAAAIVLATGHGILAVAWVAAGATTLGLVVMLVLASRVLGTPVRVFLAAWGPGLAATLGMVLAAGAVRLAWDDASAGPLIAITVAGGLGTLLSLRILAPATLDWLTALVLSRVRRGN